MKRLLHIPLCLLVLLWTNGAWAQQRTVSGNLQNISGDPVQGVTVRIMEKPAVQTTSDENGAFVIPAQIGQHLVVKKSDKAPKIVAVRQNEMTITYDSGVQEIPVGYGQTGQPEEFTAAIGVVRGDQISGSSVINPENALYGKIPGLTVLQNGGEPPTSPNMYIRGSETFSNNGILVLVDGAERPLSSLSTSEIANISILKDAASLAKYGQRGANGVLLVTTKRGNKGPLRVNVSYEQAITQPVGLPEYLEAPTYARAVNEALANDGLSHRYSQSELEAFDSGSSPYFYPNVDWFDEVLRDQGVRSTFDVTFEGGGETARYFALMNYVNDAGILDPVSQNEEGLSTQRRYGRFNFRTNVDVNVTDQLLFQVNVGGNILDNKIPAGGDNFQDIFDALYSIPSAAFPVKTPSGNWGGTQIYGNNPRAIQTATGSGGPMARELFVDGILKQDLDVLAKGLSAEVGASYTNFGSYFEQKEKQYSYEAISPVRDGQGNIIDTTSTIYGQDTDLYFLGDFGGQRRQASIHGKLNYETNINDDELSAMLLFHQDSRVFNGYDNVYHRRNFVANLHYGFNGKYYVDLTTSYSGNNLLASGDRYNFFPAVSAAWLLSEEEFLANARSLDLLKLRASWGMSGSDILPTNNPYQQSYNSGASGYWYQNGNNYQGGFSEGRLATSNFSVETSNKTNIGLDARFFGKLGVTADLFYARRSNILSSINGRVSEVIGISEPQEAEGIVENRGIELSLDWEDAVGDFAYRIGGQFSFARNNIVEMNETYRPYSYLERTGQQVGQRFGLQAIGFFESQQDIADSPRQVFSEVQPGDIKYKDQNNDGIINEFDEVPLGHANGYPEMYFSASLDLNYKGFGISALFQGVGNYTAYLNTQSVYWPLRNNNTISTYYYNNRWTPEMAGSAMFPRLTTESNDNNFRPNSIWTVDRSYIKLRSLELSYSLPLSVVQQWKMNNIRVFVRGRNLLSIDNIEVLDPENLAVGYPVLRSYNLGLEIDF